MKKLPIGVQTFQKIQEDDYVYVKTGLAVDLINRYKYVFFPVPGGLKKICFATPCILFIEWKKELLGWQQNKTKGYGEKYQTKGKKNPLLANHLPYQFLLLPPIGILLIPWITISLAIHII